MPNSTLFFITLCFSRVLVTFFFWMAGIYGVFHFAEIVQEMVTVGLPWPVLFAAGTIFLPAGGFGADRFLILPATAGLDRGC